MRLVLVIMFGLISFAACKTLSVLVYPALGSLIGCVSLSTVSIFWANTLIGDWTTLRIDSLEPLKSDVRIYVDGWKNINEPGSYNIKHYHPLSHLSGVLWIKTPDKSGDILFQSPDEFNRYQQLDCYTDDFKFQTNFYHTYRFSPIEGRILIFPSDLEHLVKINESDEDRISYSFNVSLQRPVDIVKEEEYNHEELN